VVVSDRSRVVNRRGLPDPLRARLQGRFH
jgi:hypothetical protein